jgi:hypothetical protein
MTRHRQSPRSPNKVRRRRPHHVDRHQQQMQLRIVPALRDPCRRWCLGAPTTRSPCGRAVSAVLRTTTDGHTAWAATATGRVFRSADLNATSPADARWTRLDKVAAQHDQNRFGNSIYPVEANTAHVSYSGYIQGAPGSCRSTERRLTDGWRVGAADTPELPAPTRQPSHPPRPRPVSRAEPGPGSGHARYAPGIGSGRWGGSVAVLGL